jgi:hypothetical protein
VEFFFGFATEAVFGMVNRGVRYGICIILWSIARTCL